MKNNNGVYIAVAVLAVIVAALVYYFPSYRDYLSAEALYNWYKEHLTYGTIVLLMAIESSIIPLPSEVVVPPAAYFALQHGSDMNVWMVIVMATVGATLGAIINYALSMLIGRPIIYGFADSRFGKLLMLSGEKLEYAEDYFKRKGAVSIFLGRLLPAVRHLISIPAGLSRMNITTFVTYTALGAALWNVVLALLGYLLYLVVPDADNLFARLEHYNHYLKAAGVALLAIVVIYIVYKYKVKSVKSTE